MGDPPNAPAESSSITFTVKYGKESQTLRRPVTSSVGQLKDEIAASPLGIPSANQKLMLAGKMLKQDDATLAEAGFKEGAKLMLIGSRSDH